MSNKKNLLIYAHYYIPDTASTGQILRELAEGMLDKFNITVICVVPSYLGTIEDKYKTQKYWYVVGVNVKYNTIDALIKKMREETEGMQVITVGVSSGGFIAAILASALKASYCLDFAGQFSLLHHWTHVDTNPFLKELYSKNNHCFGEAYLYLGESPIYYFEPALCEQDIEQAKYAKMCSNVKILRVRSKTHGCAISPVAFCLKDYRVIFECIYLRAT